MKQILYFNSPHYLSIKHSQLTIADKTTGDYTQRPIDDIAILVIDHYAITITQAVISHLADQGIAILFCNAAHEPCSLLFHMEAHSTQTERFRQQINTSEPLKKRLWQQVIQAKIKNQQNLLQQHDINVPLPNDVHSGDTTHTEAQAARLYWPLLFSSNFMRARHGAPPNPALNYGYAILRTATARALSMAGLLPLLGIHHRNKYNNFCLADDIMEPYRPFVDRVVKNMHDDNMDCTLELPEEKKILLDFLYEPVTIQNEQTTLMLALQRTTQSLAQCFSQEKKKIIYPILR